MSKSPACSLLMLALSARSTAHSRASTEGAIRTCGRTSSARLARLPPVLPPGLLTGLISPATHSARALGRSASGIGPRSASAPSSCAAYLPRAAALARPVHSSACALRRSERASTSADTSCCSSSASHRPRAGRPNQRWPVVSSGRTSHTRPATSSRSAVPSGCMSGTTGRGVSLVRCNSTPCVCTAMRSRPRTTTGLGSSCTVNSSTSSGGAVTVMRCPGTMLCTIT
mmetsp:Transcript_24932/g.63285  ORF Transcript_24932/g.63285 Transcript_24932/m.63285 type:complete len:228 (+) Transcript_24932:330-1013(+)